MRHARRNVQRFARFAAIGGLVCGGLMVSQAMASVRESWEPETTAKNLTYIYDARQVHGGAGSWLKSIIDGLLAKAASC